MPIDKEPAQRSSHQSRRWGRLFMELSDGRVVRRPATMLRPLTWRESMLGRPATTADIIGPEILLQEADELSELRKRFNQDSAE